MFNFSTKTMVNKEYKLVDFITQIKASKEIKDDSKKIKQIMFTHVINAQSLNSIEDSIYKNIYVIKMILKEKSIPKLFVEALDKNIAFHTCFLFEYDNEIATMLAYKEIGSTIKISSKYFTSDFKKRELIEVPLLNTVEDVYKYVLSFLIGIESRENESPKDYITRINAINRLNYQISKTESSIIYETQPKKKFLYNERVRKYKIELEKLRKKVN